MIVTIDGPAGTGKSSAARQLAERLGFSYLDTGAMYRAIALACLRAGIDRNSADGAALADSVNLRVEAGRTWLDGKDVSEAIRTPEVTAAASVVAQNPEIRRRLVDLQRRVAAGGNFVCEGRDQGTVAFPEAACKFFVTANPVTRAERRRREMLEKGTDVPLEELLRQQTERDQRDEERAVAPLRPATDALLVDTTTLTLEEVVDFMEVVVRGKLQQVNTSGS